MRSDPDLGAMPRDFFLDQARRELLDAAAERRPRLYWTQLPTVLAGVLIAVAPAKVAGLAVLAIFGLAGLLSEHLKALDKRIDAGPPRRGLGWGDVPGIVAIPSLLVVLGAVATQFGLSDAGPVLGLVMILMLASLPRQQAVEKRIDAILALVEWDERRARDEQRSSD